MAFVVRFRHGTGGELILFVEVLLLNFSFAEREGLRNCNVMRKLIPATKAFASVGRGNIRQSSYFALLVLS